MERDSLGLIETSGLVAAIEAADAGSKAANVTFRGYQRARAGLITVVFLGDVAAVRTAVTAGAAAAKRIGTVISVHVIARPDRQLHVVSNSAKPVEKLVPSAIIEGSVTCSSPTKTDESEPIAVEPLVIVTGIAPSSTGCEVCKILQADLAPAQSFTEICEEPVIAQPSHEADADVEAASDYGAGKDRSPLNEDADEETVGATRGFSGPKKEKVRKPRSKRKA